jgi:23S rRNA (cytosine1962-C5)-methyltransferase
MLKIHIKKGREKPVLNGHPWIFSGSIRRIEGNGEPGEPCAVIGYDNSILGYGYYNAKSSITVRMLTTGDEPFTLQDLRGRIKQAISARAEILHDGSTDSCRLINAEGDFLPGLVVDRYSEGLTIQICTSGMERMRTDIIDALSACCPPAFIFERSDTESREREGLTVKGGLIAGILPEPLFIRENGIRFSVDLAGGQKTGFYFDQRENRALARSYAKGRRCLDCFSYSSGFGMNLLAGNAASVTPVDSSKDAGQWSSRNLDLNQFDSSRMESVCADVFDFLRAADRTYELIVLDPPKFARRPSEVQKAARGYKDINLAAIKKLSPGGILFTFSCSSAVDARLFRQIVFSAAADAGRQVQIIHLLSAGPDHPFSIAHPEGEYLKGFVLRVP